MASPCVSELWTSAESTTVNTVVVACRDACTMVRASTVTLVVIGFPGVPPGCAEAISVS